MTRRVIGRGVATAGAEPALPVPVTPALAFRPIFSRSSPLFVLFLTLRI